MLVKLSNQGTPNKNIVFIGNLTLYFSYKTIIAFSSPKTGFVCRENSWSTTTGKFLNEICPDHKKRIKSEEFEKQLEKLLKRIKVV